MTRGTLLGLVALLGCASPASPTPEAMVAAGRVRVAVFNTSLFRKDPGGLARDLATGSDPQLRDVAAILDAVRPDIVALLEVDHDAAVSSALREALGDYPYWVAPPVNTGKPSGFDLDRDGRTDGPGDALGYGAFPGQFGMLVLSRFPIDTELRCWGELLWRDMPGAPMPRDWYSDAALARLPVSSKNHCDVVISVAGRPLHLLLSHPTPPVFDGPEDRNGLRNAAEIALWSDYLDGASYLGPALPADARFVVAGDLNADPNDGDSRRESIARLLAHPRLASTPAPSSEGASVQAERDGGANASHVGAHAHDTADFPDHPPGPGNLRTDYLLPSKTLDVIASGVLWPAPGQPLHDAVACSDHRLVWLDVDG